MTRALFLGAFPVLLIGACTRQQRFVRDYPDGARLTPAQERIVVELAARERVVDIEAIEIRSTHGPAWKYPDWKCVLVRERATVKGRQVAYRLVRIGYLPWTPEWDWPPAHAPLVEGFWVEGTHRWGYTILNARGREYRVVLSRELTMGEAEQLISTFLGALEDGNFELAHRVDEDGFKVVRSDLKHMNLGELRLGEATDAYSVTFVSIDANLAHGILFTVEGEQIKIVEMSTRRSE